MTTNDRAMNPEMAIVPCGIVDAIWHAHILDTTAHGPDCERVFGFFLHHFPYFGMRGDGDAADLADAYELTLERYIAAFGAAPDELWRSKQGAKRPYQLQAGEVQVEPIATASITDFVILGRP